MSWGFAHIPVACSSTDGDLELEPCLQSPCQGRVPRTLSSVAQLHHGMPSLHPHFAVAPHYLREEQVMEMPTCMFHLP